MKTHLTEVACCFLRKEILQEYFDLSSVLNDEVVSVHTQMANALKAIQPQREYDNFIQQNRYISSPFVPRFS